MKKLTAFVAAAAVMAVTAVVFIPKFFPSSKKGKFEAFGDSTRPAWQAGSEKAASWFAQAKTTITGWLSTSESQT